MGTFATGKPFFVMKFQSYGALLQDIYICMNVYMFMYDVGHS